MSRSTDLIKNTLLLGMSKVATQMVAFLLVPLYTFFLSPDDFGSVDLIITYITLAVPFLTIQLEFAAFRFAIDARGDDKKLSQLLSTIFAVILPFTIIVAGIFFLISLLIDIPHVLLIILNIFTSVISAVILQFSRGIGKTKSFAAATVIAGLITTIASVIFIAFLRLPASSILLATSMSNIAVIIYLTSTLGLIKRLRPGYVNYGIRKKLLAYSLPLLPNNISWWVLNVSDRTIITIFLGLMSNGIYAIAYKFAFIPGALFGVFNMSWSETASAHINASDRDSYFSKICDNAIRIYSSIATLFIATLPIIFSLIVGSEYLEAYNYIPILVMGALAQGLVGIYSAIYIAKKKTKEIANTSLMAAGINIVVNLSLIYFIGIYAAAVSTFVAFFAMFIYRHYDVKKYVKITYQNSLLIKMLIPYLVILPSYYINNVYLNYVSLLAAVLLAIILNKAVVVKIKHFLSSYINKKIVGIVFRYALVVIWALMIFVLSNEVSGISSSRSAAIVGTVSNILNVNITESLLTFIIRKSAHIFMYFVLGILMYNAISYNKKSVKSTIILSALLSFGYAIIDEVHQLFVAGRSCELRDIIIDIIASLAGLCVYILLLKIVARIKNQRIINNYILKISQVTASMLLILSFSVAIWQLFQSGMIPNRYLIIYLMFAYLSLSIICIISYRKKSSNNQKLSMIIVSVLMIIMNYFVYSIGSSMNSFIDNIQADSNIVASQEKVDVTVPFTVYISGIDTYGDIESISRSDVNIIAIVNPDTHKILLVNTPRDYYVQLHGTTGMKDKLTHAGIYGVDMSINTLQDLYDIEINYYVRVNFSSLTKIVDTLGGIDVYSEVAFESYGEKFNQGYNHLDGKRALVFSRERYNLAGGDRARGQNQQRVIEAVINKLNNPSTILKYQNILNSLQSAFQTNIDSKTTSSLIRNQIDDIKKWQVESISVDGSDSHSPTYSMGSMNLYVIEPNLGSIESAKQKISQYQ